MVEMLKCTMFVVFECELRKKGHNGLQHLCVLNIRDIQCIAIIMFECFNHTFCYMHCYWNISWSLCGGVCAQIWWLRIVTTIANRCHGVSHGMLGRYRNLLHSLLQVIVVVTAVWLWSPSQLIVIVIDVVPVEDRAILRHDTTRDTYSNLIYVMTWHHVW